MTHDASARSPYRLGERNEADTSEESVSTLQRPNLDGYPSLHRANHSRPHESQATHPGSTLQSRGQKHHKSKEVDSPWGRVVPTSPVRSTSSNSKDRSKVNRIALIVAKAKRTPLKESESLCQPNSRHFRSAPCQHARGPIPKVVTFP